MIPYQDAYNELEKYVLATPISEQTFIELQAKFREDYLASKQFRELMKTHRNPSAVRNELLREINDYLIAIQNRKEMRDIDPDTHTFGYAPTKIGEMWHSNKSLRSLYKSVQVYCEIRQNNFTTVAIHIAEYRALYRLYNRVRKQADKSGNRYGNPVS
jgi:hypothetical protein